jgi:hypothetical protein
MEGTIFLDSDDAVALTLHQLIVGVVAIPHTINK